MLMNINTPKYNFIEEETIRISKELDLFKRIHYN